MTDRQITAHGSFEALHRQYLKERDVASVNCRIAIYGFAQWLDERFRNTIETCELLSIARDLSTMDCFWSASGHHEADCKCLSGRAERAVAAHTRKAGEQQ